MGRRTTRVQRAAHKLIGEKYDQSLMVLKHTITGAEVNGPDACPLCQSLVNLVLLVG